MKKDVNRKKMVEWFDAEFDEEKEEGDDILRAKL